MMSSEAALIRKISIRLIPFLFLLYIVSYLDRVTFSNASMAMSSGGLSRFRGNTRS